MINTTYFDTIDKEKKAYWLGFIHADGHISKKYISILLSARDRKHLVKIATLFNKPIGDYSYTDNRTNKTYHQTRCVLHSTHMCKSLLENGAKEDSGRIYKAIPQNMYPHFIRGYFDGDGSFGQYGTGNKNSYRLTIVGESNFLIATREILILRLGLRRNAIQERKGISAIAWSGVWSIVRIRDYMYKNATIWMERKRDLLDKVPNKRGISQYVGVYQHTRDQTWIARLYYDGKTRHIGVFSDEIDAAKAYDRIAFEKYGHSAMINFPSDIIDFDTATPQVISDFMGG